MECLDGRGYLYAVSTNHYKSTAQLVFPQIIEGIATVCVGILAFFGKWSILWSSYAPGMIDRVASPC